MAPPQKAPAPFDLSSGIVEEPIDLSGGLITEESEHARQLKPAQPLPSIIRPSKPLDQILAPSGMTGNDPNTLRGYGRTWAEFLKGAGRGIVDFLATPLPGSEQNPVIWNPATQIKKDWQGIKNLYEQSKTNPNYAAGEVVGPALLTHTITRLLTPAGMAAKLTRGTGGMASDIEPTLDDLRAVTKEANPKTGTKFGAPKTVGDFVEQVGAAEDKLNKEYANALGPYANRPGPITPDGKFPVAEAILKLKEKIGDTTPEDKAARAYIDKTAALFQKPLTLDELNRQRIAANGRLYSFENKSDVAQYAASGANAGTAVDKAIANTVRDVVYPEMDRLTGKPAGYFRDLQNRVGNLFRLQSDSKQFASDVHQKMMVERGSTPLERVRPGGAVSMRGGIHGYFSNIPQVFKAENPEAEANSAVRSAYGVRQRIELPPEIMSQPLTEFLTAIHASAPPQGPKSQKIKQIADDARAQPSQ